MLSDFQFEHLEGWLIKKHSTERKMNFGRSTESRRWFKVSEVKGLDSTECILGYYSSQKVKEAKGFIYLQDVKEIETVGPLGFSLKTPARNLNMLCETKPELKMWLEGLVKLCPEADIKKITENISLPLNRDSDAKKSSTATPPRNMDAKSSSDDEGKTNDDDDGRLKMPGKSSSPDRTELKSMKLDEDRYGDERTNEKTRSSKGGGVVGRFEETVDGHDRASRQSGSRDREDHRISGFHPGAGSGATSRLHAHINNEAAGDAVLKPPSKELRSSKDIVTSSSSSLVKRTTTEVTSSTRTSKTEWIEGGAVELQHDEYSNGRRSPNYSEYYADVPDIDDLGNLEMAPEPNDQPSETSRLSKENKRQSENYSESSKGGGMAIGSMKGKAKNVDATKTLRKASDGLYGESQGKSKTRSSIDDLISSQSSPGSRDYKRYDDDDDDPFDLALEKKRLAEIKAKMEAKGADGAAVGLERGKEIASLDIGSAYRSRSSSVSGTPRSRSNSILEQHLLEREGRVSIPQPPSDEKPPYAQKVAMASPVDAKRGDESKLTSSGRAPGKPMKQPSSAFDVKMSSEQLAKYGIGQGVAADDNWLEEDFDS